MTNRWQAVYSDNSILNQFNADGSENLFKDIEQDKLVEFRLFHDSSVISIFLTSGVFGLNGLLYQTDVSNQDLDYRLIHFVRRRKILGAGRNQEMAFVGFQVNIGGKNHKRILSVCDGEIKFVND